MQIQFDGLTTVLNIYAKGRRIRNKHKPLSIYTFKVVPTKTWSQQPTPTIIIKPSRKLTFLPLVGIALPIQEYEIIQKYKYNIKYKTWTKLQSD